MNPLTRFLRLFNIKYQIDFRSAVFELNLKIQHDKARVFVIQNQSTAIPTAEFLIDLLKNSFTSSEQVYDHIVDTIETELIENHLGATKTDQITGIIQWQEIFDALDRIKPYDVREQVRSKLKIYQIVSDVFGWSKKPVL